ncbi:MAG: hypothetical protein J5526_02360 [Bacteroidales bacterium]|nr:hypothetical protein [Bacteroidales bacterium]
MDEVLDKYLSLLSNMKRANVGGYKAPHKVLLLMTVCNMVESGMIVDNRIVLSRELEKEFAGLWKEVVDNEESMPMDCVAEVLFMGQRKVYPFNCNIANPYYHLSGEPFWRLVKSLQWENRSSWSVPQLRKCFEYATMDEGLFQLILYPETRQKIYLHLDELLKG